MINMRKNVFTHNAFSKYSSFITAFRLSDPDCQWDKKLYTQIRIMQDFYGNAFMGLLIAY